MWLRLVKSAFKLLGIFKKSVTEIRKRRPKKEGRVPFSILGRYLLACWKENLSGLHTCNIDIHTITSTYMVLAMCQAPTFSFAPYEKLP